MKNNIEDNSFLVIHRWMISILNLTGAELQIYALIFGFSQDGKSWYMGGSSYITKWLEISESQTRRTLKQLLEKELICKRENPATENTNVLLFWYKTNLDKIPSFSK